LCSREVAIRSTAHVNKGGAGRSGKLHSREANSIKGGGGI
jgi:hypothetical protein